ncbi:unnamed protein product [Peniophora sp. CBMAI 1063]|nr:unnamed protein product [Peniophora sp. CBMAI 1063]
MSDTTRLVGDAAVDARSIVWLRGLTEQQKSDILCSTLLAQLSAEAESPAGDESKATQWYNKFIGTLGNVGWVIRKSASSGVKESLIKGPVADTILNALEADENADKELYSSVARELIDMLRAGYHSKAESVLDAASISSSAHFAGIQLAVAESVDDSLVLTIFGYFYSSSNNIGTALWHPIQEGAAVSIKQFFVQLALNESVYAGVREAVIKKLEEADKMGLIVSL